MHSPGVRPSFYGRELARVHDEGFGDFARAAARELNARLPPRGTIVELGCGTGITAQMLGASGHDVVGVDISGDMLAIARSRAPAATFLEASLWTVDLPPCIAVAAIGEVVNYAADEHSGPERLPELFARVRRALTPGGLFVFDFATHGRGSQGSGPGERRGDGWRIEYAAHEDCERGLLERRMSIVTGDTVTDERHRLYLYDKGSVRDMLETEGFAVEELDGYDNFPFWPGYAAFAALRPR